MLTIYTLTSVGEAKSYYIEGHTQEAYYSEGQEFTGYWVGKSASRLKLAGRVDEKSFAALCENRNPETGAPLTARTQENRRVGYDFTFGVPKSVSLAYAWTKDERIIQRIRQAVSETVEDIERKVAARVRKRGQDFDRTTGNLAGAEFVHLTARPVNGFPDPHLHVHVVIPNATFDEVEKQWKAIQMGDVMEIADYYDKQFLARLAEQLKLIGLEITPTEKAFELTGFSRKLVERYSRRTKKIEETAERLGITDPSQKARLAALTRESKVKSLLFSDLDEFWWAGLSEEEKKPFQRVEALLKQSRAMEAAEEIRFEPDGSKVKKTSDLLGQENEVRQSAPKKKESLNRRTRPVAGREESPVVVTEHDRRAVAFAMKNIFERQSTVRVEKIIAEAFNGWNLGHATWGGVCKVVEELPLLHGDYKGRPLVTTSEIVAEEQRLIDLCLDGKWKQGELNPGWKIEDEKLNDQQRGAVRHVLNSRDWVIGIAGRAGTGKTTLLHEVRRGVEAGMHRLIPLAPSSEAARDTLRNEGFKNAETVAQLLHSEKLQKEARGAVWVIDEAGLLSTRQAERLLRLAKELDARQVILVGDSGQHHSVERGQAFDLLEKFAHLDVAQVEEIMRQKGYLKQVVKSVAEKDVDKAFRLLKRSGDLREMTLEERKVALAADYVAAIERGKTALVVAPTHAECNDVSDGIRERMKEKKMLGKGGEWDILRDLSWTQAAKEDFTHYAKGQVVQFNQRAKGFALGERVEVIDASDGAVRVRRRGRMQDAIVALPLHESEKFNVYERDKIEICPGEKIRIRINSRTADGHRVSNGNLYKVDYIDHEGQLVLENGRKLGKDFAHLDYGYTLTSHAAQSKTVDCVFVAQTAKLSYHASDLNQFYVAISRGRLELKIYTDNIELLQEIVSTTKERPMAAEIIHNVEEEEGLAKMSESLGSSGPAEMTMDAIQALETIMREKKTSEQDLKQEKEVTMGMG
jgi:conjugative relaxase-like TrwC/TraI family protein